MNKSLLPKVLIMIALLCSFGIIILAGIWLAFIYPRSVVIGNGKIIEETRDLSDFRKVYVQDGIKVNLRQKSATSVKVNSEENIIKQIQTTVHADTLYIEIERSAIFNQRTVTPTKEIVIDLEVKNISEIRLINAILDSSSRIRTDKLILNASGNSQINIDIFATDLDVNISNFTQLKMQGAVNNQRIDISGESTFQASELESMSTIININGRGNSSVRASESLIVNINGTASLTYFGSPERLDQNVRGGGKVLQERD